MKLLTTCFLLTLTAHLVSSQTFEQIPLPPHLVMSESEMIVYKDSLFFVLEEEDDPFANYLYRYDGTNLFNIPLPEGYSIRPWGVFEVFQDKIYMILTNTPLYPPSPPDFYSLFAYDGTFHEVPLPPGKKLTAYQSDLVVYNNQLFMNVADSYWEYANSLMAFDGTNFSVYDYPTALQGGVTRKMEVLNDILYTVSARHPPDRDQLIAFNGTAFESHLIPRIWGGRELEAYNGNLYMITGDRYAGSFLVNGNFTTFDGTAFNTVANPARKIPWSSTHEPFDGNLYTIMRDTARATNELFHYNGTSFTQIPTPSTVSVQADAHFTVYGCRLFFSSHIGNSLYSYGPPNCTSYSYFVIPKDLREFDFFGLSVYGRERDWCWTDLYIDWEINPICPDPIPCPKQMMAASLRDKKDNLVWAKRIVDHPLQVAFPVADKNLYELTLSSFQNRSKLSDFITLDKNLVPAGIEKISMKIKPQTDFFYLDVATEKNNQVPFTITLLNEQGKPVWKENFVAPFNKEISAYSTEPGSLLVFSIPGDGDFSNTIGSSWFKYYPNPVSGKLNVDFENGKSTEPVVIRIYDFFGNMIYQEKGNSSTRRQMDLTGQKPGLYILSVSNGETNERVIIQVD